jgi:hypothetical protein
MVLCGEWADDNMVDGKVHTRSLNHAGQFTLELLSLLHQVRYNGIALVWAWPVLFRMRNTTTMFSATPTT